MRTASDVLTSPKPGDVVKIGESLLTISRADEDFAYSFSGFMVDAPLGAANAYPSWREWWADVAKNAEVIHVAE
jgi:hypothetical protein